MTLLILEAFAALAVLVFIVWWTMFSGRRNGERRTDSQAPNDLPNDTPRERRDDAAGE